MEIIKHTSDLDQKWDEFVLTDSVNGTFLQSRNFLNYHKNGKFKDCSIIFQNGTNNFYAVIPACEIENEDEKIFYSHLGSTYGGIVIAKQRYNLKDISSIIESFEEFIRSEKYTQVFLKITPDLFSSQNTDLLQYFLFLNSYSQFTELSTYIDFADYGGDIFSNYSYARLKQYKKCEKANMKFLEYFEDHNVSAFYDLLVENLARHGVKPVHTLDELLEFKNNRLSDIVHFYGVELEEKAVAGAMSFYFENSNTLHIQYSGASRDLGTLSPMTYLFTGLIKFAKENGMRYLSWGISTEDKGRILNLPLAETKESYGSKFALNRTFYKRF